MSDAFYRAEYYRQKESIEALRNWIEEAISKPAMSREHRFKGADVVVASYKAEGGYLATVDDPLPKQVREAIQRICPIDPPEEEIEARTHYAWHEQEPEQEMER